LVTFAIIAAHISGVDNVLRKDRSAVEARGCDLLVPGVGDATHEPRCDGRQASVVRRSTEDVL
jgi:hypothetical protein